MYVCMYYFKGVALTSRTANHSHSNCCEYWPLRELKSKIGAVTSLYDCYLKLEF